MNVCVCVCVIHILPVCSLCRGSQTFPYGMKLSTGSVPGCDVWYVVAGCDAEHIDLLGVIM